MYEQGAVGCIAQHTRRCKVLSKHSSTSLVCSLCWYLKRLIICSNGCVCLAKYRLYVVKREREALAVTCVGAPPLDPHMSFQGAIWILRNGSVYVDESVEAEDASIQETGTFVACAVCHPPPTRTPCYFIPWSTLFCVSTTALCCAVAGSFQQFASIKSARTAIGHKADGTVIILQVRTSVPS